MSKLFFDHLLDFEKVDKEIKKATSSKEEQEEIWKLVDEIIHHKAMDSVLERLPRHNHEEFLNLFHTSPHDEKLIIGYLKEKIGENVEGILRQELGNLAFDLLTEIKGRESH